jgi:hypothetical protein
MGSLSMISYGVDVPVVPGDDDAGPAAVLPQEPPPEATNA